jgi:hypothetical protein
LLSPHSSLETPCFGLSLPSGSAGSFVGFTPGALSSAGAMDSHSHDWQSILAGRMAPAVEPLALHAEWHSQCVLSHGFFVA